MTNLRVFAEEREPGLVHLTWEWPEESSPRDAAADRRAVAAALHTRQRIESCKPDGEGVLVKYNPEDLEKHELASILRDTLAVEGDLKTRSNDLFRRIPTYLKLTQKLALDDRVSPLPDAARNMAASRGSRSALPLQMLPGFRLISRLHLILPALQSLASWSRDAPPEVVEGHLSKAGLTREQLDRDHATAQEMMLYARDVSGEKAAEVGRKAGELTSQAAVVGKQWWNKAREKRDEFIESREAEKTQPSASQPESEEADSVQVPDKRSES